jgi:hypothetical protein
MKTAYQRLSDNLTAAVDTGNREMADEAFAEAITLESKELTASEFEDIADDYYTAIAAGEI